MGSIFYYLETAVVLVVMFSVLVAAHELGHYLFARLFNMGVEEFAIGFGKKPIFQWMKRTYTIPIKDDEVAAIVHTSSGIDIEGSGHRPAEDMVEEESPSGKILRETTRFTVRPWPLGGFVRIKGMLPEEDGSETTIAGGFYNKPPIQRLVVLFAGPLFSVLAGILILTPLYMTTGKGVPDLSPQIGAVSPEGPAGKAGLKEKDIVDSVDGKPISKFYELISIVRVSPDKELTLGIHRQGKPMTIKVTPILEKKPSPVLGPDLEPTKEMKIQAKLLTGPNVTRVPVGFTEALAMAVSRPVEAVTGLFDMLKKPATIKDSVGGTISITVVTYDRVQQGLAAIFELAALLSISVGILNLLPIVPLDGGQMALCFAELFRGGRRLSMKVQNVASLCGMAFIGMLIISVCFLDINRLFTANQSSKPAASKKANP